MRFRTTVLQDGGACGIEVPPDIVTGLGSGKRPPVTITINGYTYRSTVAVMGGAFMVGVSAEHRPHAGVKGGDEVDVDIELDQEPRVVTVPDDFARALESDEDAHRTFDTLSYSDRRWHVLSIEGARTQATRERRIEKSIEMLRLGRKR